MDSAMLHSIWTVLLLVVFIGIVVWVFVIRKSSDYDEAARMPLDSAGTKDQETPEGERRDG